MNKILFNVNKSDFINTIKSCNNDQNCSLNVSDYNKTIGTDNIEFSSVSNTNSYNKLLNNIKSHFNYIISINEQTKLNFKGNIDNETINKRYVHYDSIDINYQNTWVKRFTFWIYFIGILLYISVFILKNLYKKKIEFLYLAIVISTPFLSKKALEFINMFYKYNILFVNN